MTSVMPQSKPKLIPLPCPFCGKKPAVAPKNPAVDGNAWGAVYCNGARCAARPYVADGQSSADNRGTGAYIDCAIKRWNRRAEKDGGAQT